MNNSIFDLNIPDKYKLNPIKEIEKVKTPTWLIVSGFDKTLNSIGPAFTCSGNLYYKSCFCNGIISFIPNMGFNLQLQFNREDNVNIKLPELESLLKSSPKKEWISIIRNTIYKTTL